jgi:hypothetical protein
MGLLMAFGRSKTRHQLCSQGVTGALIFVVLRAGFFLMQPAFAELTLFDQDRKNSGFHILVVGAGWLWRMFC